MKYLFFILLILVAISCTAEERHLILIGEGILPPDIALIPDTLQFGRVSQYNLKDLTAQLHNLGGDTARVILGLPSECEADWTILGGPERIVLPGEFALVTIRYRPMQVERDTCSVTCSF